MDNPSGVVPLEILAVGPVVGRMQERPIFDWLDTPMGRYFFRRAMPASTDVRTAPIRDGEVLLQVNPPPELRTGPIHLLYAA